MLTGLGLKNFKCFESLDLRLAPLTLLCGSNGAGKSSIIQSLLLLRQSKIGSALETGTLLLRGPLVDLGTGRDVLFEDSASEVLEFSLQSSDTPERLRLKSDSIKDKFRLNLESARSSVLSHDMRPDNLSDGRRLSGKTVGPSAGDNWQWNHIPPFGGQVVYVRSERSSRHNNLWYTDIIDCCKGFDNQREVSMDHSSLIQNRPLPNDDIRCNGIPDRCLSSVVEHWFEELIPRSRLRLERVKNPDLNTAGFSFMRRGGREKQLYHARNVGFGSLHVIPVLMALLAQSGSLCLIENPEAYLHPRGQTKLSELAVRAALAGVQLIVETHSDHFFDGIRIAIRDRVIPPDDVAIHSFRHTGSNAEVTSPVVDSDGRLSSWPEGFFDQHEENLSRLLAPKA